MVGRIDRCNYRITHSPLSDVNAEMLVGIEGLVLSVHVADDETRVVEGFDGYDVKIDVEREYDGDGTLYLVELSKAGEYAGMAGIGVSEVA